MENFHKFFKTYPDMDIELLNGFLREYIQHCKDLEIDFLPIHDSSEADCCDDDPYDPYLNDDYDKDFDSIVWPSEVGPQDSKALEELRRKMDDSPDDEEDYDYSDDEFDYDADEQYVTASTSYNANETFYFMSDEHGVHGGHELGCSMAERWGNVHWNMPSRIDSGIEDEFPNHYVKLARSYRIEPDQEHNWAVEKRVYRVTKRQ